MPRASWFRCAVAVLLLSALATLSAEAQRRPGGARRVRRMLTIDPRSRADTIGLPPAERARVFNVVAPFLSRMHYVADINGGRMTLSVMRADSAQLQAIRLYLHDLTAALNRSDFSLHFRKMHGEVPGANTMLARKSFVFFSYSPTPWGGEIYLMTADDDARTAIREFLEYQRRTVGFSP